MGKSIRTIGFLLSGMFSFSAATLNAGGHDTANAFGFALVVPKAQEQRVDRVLASHREFMSNTHSVTGDMETRLNSYSVIKAPELVQFGDPSKGMTGNIIYILSEHYETPGGLANHLEAGSNWADIGEMQQLMYDFSVASAFGNKISAMNR